MLTPRVQLTLEKAPRNRKNDNNSPESNSVDWEAVGLKAAVVQETAETVGKLMLKAYVAKRVLDTVCEIAVIAAKVKLK